MIITTTPPGTPPDFHPSFPTTAPNCSLPRFLVLIHRLQGGGFELPNVRHEHWGWPSEDDDNNNNNNNNNNNEDHRGEDCQVRGGSGGFCAE